MVEKSRCWKILWWPCVFFSVGHLSCHGGVFAQGHLSCQAAFLSCRVVVEEAFWAVSCPVMPFWHSVSPCHARPHGQFEVV